MGARRSGGRPSGLLQGHPARLLRPSYRKASGLAFDGGKLNEMYQSKITRTRPALVVSVYFPFLAF
jgi:hypothetical protein